VCSLTIEVCSDDEAGGVVLNAKQWRLIRQTPRMWAHAVNAGHALASETRDEICVVDIVARSID
jgi:hypothetical protein